MATMHPRPILTSASILQGLIGALALFAPEVALAGIGQPDGDTARLMMGLLGGLLLGFSYLNWMARGTPVGGIYGRPISGANLVLFLTSALTLGKGADLSGTAPIRWVVVALFGVYAVLFGRMLLTHPQD